QCVEGSTPCAGLADCTSSRGCGSGSICAVATCCGRNVCVPQSAFCSSNGPLMVLLPGEEGSSIGSDAQEAAIPLGRRMMEARTAPGEIRLLFGVPGSSLVRLAVYDVSGRRVRLLLQGSFDKGNYLSVWDGRDDVGRVARRGL